jgi:hypothetical protein
MIKEIDDWLSAFRPSWEDESAYRVLRSTRSDLHLRAAGPLFSDYQIPFDQPSKIGEE